MINETADTVNAAINRTALVATPHGCAYLVGAVWRDGLLVEVTTAPTAGDNDERLTARRPVDVSLI